MYGRFVHIIISIHPFKHVKYALPNMSWPKSYMLVTVMRQVSPVENPEASLRSTDLFRFGIRKWDQSFRFLYTLKLLMCSDCRY